MSHLRRQPDSMFDSRVLGGYAVIPTPHTLKASRDAGERLDVVLATLEAHNRLGQSLNALLDDTLIELREQGRKWETLARRTGHPKWKLTARVKDRLAKRRNGHADPDRVLADDLPSAA